eukprot:TRINITY_DN2376_c1_g1_i2.p1 TRINITY_DN2376_c1_g1~~TRINITY_DN2376_c1_g1_i2.p1  ORF type:complete len:152 (-),score=14.64 TRINITY_DN2376_c1_g1_i2:227-625(-)
MPKKQGTKRKSETSLQHTPARQTKYQVEYNPSQQVEKMEFEQALEAVQPKPNIDPRKQSMIEMMKLQEQLLKLEQEIYDIETTYLERAPPFNAVRGYESLLLRGIQNYKMAAKDEERLFSGSSITGRVHLNQ